MFNNDTKFKVSVVVQLRRTHSGIFRQLIMKLLKTIFDEVAAVSLTRAEQG